MLQNYLKPFAYLPFSFLNIRKNSSISKNKLIKFKFINDQKDNKNTIENTWIEYRCQEENEEGIIITKELLELILKQFNNDIILNLKEKQYINVLLKIKMLPENEDKPVFRSITKMQRVNKDSIWSLLNIFFDSWEIKAGKWGHQSGDCRTFKIIEVIYSYKIMPLEISNKDNNDKTILNKTIIKTDTFKNLEFSAFNIPSTADYTKWGEIILKEFNSLTNDFNKIIIKPTKKDCTALYHVTLFDDYNFVEYKVNDTVILKFTDQILDKNNLNTFRRTVDDKKIFDFVNGEVVLKRKKTSLFKIEKLKEEKSFNNKIITMDIETMTIKGELIPYCVCIYNIKNKKEKISFYLTDYKDSEQMLIESIKFLMKRKFDGFKVYLHNFSNFDGIFYLKLLTDLARKIDPIINDGNFINIRINFDKRYRLSFRDSYLMLPASLRDLCKSFNVINKGIFPIYFLMDNYNSNIDLNYNGPIPDYIYFSGISEEEFNIKFKDKSEKYWKLNKFNGITPEIYKNYCEQFEDKNNWNLKNESIKYCMNDCESLYEVLLSFSKEIFEMFSINVLSYPTLPSLAFAIFRHKFMKNENIPLISGPLYDFIKEGYYGGHVEVYTPYGKNVKRYDANSLYPSVMESFDMPVGNPIIFEGDINHANLDLNNYLGFFKVEIETTNYLEHPILLKRVNNKTIAPLGKWTGVYSTVEINKCLELGYKFKILSGVLFDRENIFKDYVNFFYDIKKNVQNSDPKYTIAKLFLNTLYGRFGMNPCLDKHKIVDKKEFYEIEKKFQITASLDLKNGKELISYSEENEINDFQENRTNVSVSIAAMVTAYARIFMSQFKNNPNYTLFYSDTDSIDLDVKLDLKYVGKDLRQMKLENVFEEAVYLAPKVYAAKVFNEELNKTEDLVKVKGLKNPISFNEMKELLIKDSNLQTKHEKWFKSIEEGKIYVKDQIYTLSITDSKRELIFDSQGNFIKTKPIEINET
jgi:DNA polymerase family B